MATQTFVLSLSNDTLEHLRDLAAHRGVSTDTLVSESVENMLAWEKEALQAHEEGLRQIERGEFYTNEEVRALLDAAIQKRNAA